LTLVVLLNVTQVKIMRVDLGKQKVLNLRDIQTVCQFDAKYLQFSMHIIVV